MEAKIDGKKLIITIDADLDPKASASGKTLIVSSSRGNQATGATVKGKPVIIGLNAYIHRD